VTVVAASVPVVVGVVPAGGYVDPARDLDVVVQLSEAPALPLHMSSLAPLFTLRARNVQPLPAVNVQAASATSLRVTFRPLAEHTVRALSSLVTVTMVFNA
jgi:hypothetical protein